MIRRVRTSFAVIFRFYGDNIGYFSDRLAAVCRFLDRPVNSRFRATWNFPVYPWMKRPPPLLQPVFERIQSGIDTLCILGYSGAPWHVLYPDELEFERTAVFTQSWGVLDNEKDDHPEFILPLPTDNEIIGAQNRFGGNDVFLHYPKTAYSPLSLRLSRLSPADMRKSGVIFDLCSPKFNISKALKLLGKIRNLETGGRIELNGFFDLEPFRPAKRNTRATPANEYRKNFLPDHPRYRYFRLPDGAASKHRPEQRLQRHAKGMLVGPVAEERYDSFNISERALYADMTGEVSIIDDRMTAHFNGGRLSGIDLDGKDFTTRKSANSSIRTRHGIARYARESAFSFEGRHIRGLREHITIDHESFREKGSIIHDYFFIDGIYGLFISTIVRYPVFPDRTVLREMLLLEIPVWEIGQDESVTVISVKGHEETSRTIGTEGIYHFWGDSFTLTNGRRYLTLSFPQSTRYRTELLPVRIGRKGNRKSVFMNPFGYYFPVDSAAVDGYAEKATYIIQVELDTRSKPVLLRDDVIKEIIPHWVARR